MDKENGSYFPRMRDQEQVNLGEQNFYNPHHNIQNTSH